MNATTATTQTETGEVDSMGPECFNVQFRNVTANSLKVRAVDDEWTVAHVGDVLYLSFESRAEARRFFARGVELVRALPAISEATADEQTDEEASR